MSKRTTKASRAASLKGWRTRRKMQEARKSISQIGLERYQASLNQSLDEMEAARRRSLQQLTGRSADLLPKVEW